VDALIYAQPATTGSLEQHVDRLNGDFMRLAQEVPLAA
jgi:hypothetical protein